MEAMGPAKNLSVQQVVRKKDKFVPHQNNELWRAFMVGLVGSCLSIL